MVLGDSRRRPFLLSVIRRLRLDTHSYFEPSVNSFTTMSQSCAYGLFFSFINTMDRGDFRCSHAVPMMFFDNELRAPSEIILQLVCSRIQLESLIPLSHDIGSFPLLLLSRNPAGLTPLTELTPPTPLTFCRQHPRTQRRLRLRPSWLRRGVRLRREPLRLPRFAPRSLCRRSRLAYGWRG